MDRAPSITNAVDLLRHTARVFPDCEAYVEIGRRLTFSGWDRAADGLAAAFADHGVGRGDVVTLLLPSSIDYAVCYQAAMRLGAITSGINTRLGAKEIGSILSRTGSKLLVLDGDVEPPGEAPPMLARTQLAELFGLDPPIPLPEVRPSDPVAVVWTSGTTGIPKGAIFDHTNLAAVAAGAGDLGAPFDRRFSATPFAHVGYMSRPWEEIEKVITTIIPPTPWKAADALRLMQDERVTVGQGVPTQWRLMLNLAEFDRTDLSSLRIAGTGASTVPPDLVREMRKRVGCPVVIGYTSTEAAITTGSRPGDSTELICSTVGRARVNVELEVVDEDGSPLQPGHVGRVRCRSGAVMRGYWRDPDRTADVLGTDGWLSTGDLGSLDDDGYLTLVGRGSEMYIRGGYNVYPAEVERTLTDHPGVEQAAVVGRSDPILGEIGVAFVVPAAGLSPSRDELRAWCTAALADYKAPDLVQIVERLPLTSMAKIDKRALSELATGLPLSRGRA